MKNKFLNLGVIMFIIIIQFISFNAYSSEEFNFNVTEIEILKNGNLIKGLKRGVVSSNNGIYIEADTFEYDKLSNILNADGNVKFVDKIKDHEIYSDSVTYNIKINKIITKNNSKAIYKKDIVIEGDIFEYDKLSSILNAIGNVKIIDRVNDYKIYSENVIYKRNTEEIETKGNTNFQIESKYKINSKNVNFNRKKNILNSINKTTIKDKNFNLFILDELSYQISDEILKGKNIIVITNHNKPDSDKYFFSSGIIDLKKDSIIAKNPEITLHKKIFNNDGNDPRLFGVSATSVGNLTIIEKGIFTSCKKRDDCPPWSIKAERITHDKEKKQLEYKNAVVQVYDIPILYLPKFFHPDPSVKRQSGLLKPQINNSNILGNSINAPYYKVLSGNKDLTFTPTFFENNLMMIENEYRQKNKDSELLLNLGYVNNYKSSSVKKSKNIFSIFSEYKGNLKLQNFVTSSFNLSLERVTNDTYLKVFDQNIKDSNLKPKDPNILNSNINLSLEHENYDFEAGFSVYEDLQKVKSDRYQYVLPYFDFDKEFNRKYLRGNIDFSSSGNNNLIDTNRLETSIINDINYIGNEFITDYGFKNNITIDIKNLNSAGKNSAQYKSSPQIELMSMYSFNSSFPMIKKQEGYNNYFTPKISLKINPHDMKDYSITKKNINAKNIFSNNRLGLTDSLESGRSLTLGLNFKKENKNNINNFFEMSLATVLRDEEEEFIPNNTSINKKQSNIFGHINTKFSEIVEFKYNFALDNNYNELLYNELNTTLTFGNLETEFGFIKEKGLMGNDNIFENITRYEFDKNNFLSFKTRRNRKINLTEYYNLIYEYKNDCLTAGIKYNKTYYEDKDLKPSENLFFSMTLIPLGEYEQKFRP